MKRCFLLLVIFSHVNADFMAKIAPGYKAFSAYEDKNFIKAESAYAQNLEEDPYDAVANYNLGTTLYKQSKFVEAKHHFERSVKNALESKAFLERSLFNLGNSCMQLAQYQAAIDVYEEVLGLNSDNDRAQKNLELARMLLEEQKRKEEEQKKEESKKDCDQQKDQQKDDQQKDQQSDKGKQENKPGNKDKDDTQKQDKSDDGDQDDSDQPGQKEKKSDRQGDDESQDSKQKNKSEQDSKKNKKDQSSGAKGSEQADRQQDKNGQKKEQGLDQEQLDQGQNQDQGLQKSKEEQKLEKEVGKQGDHKEDSQKNNLGQEQEGAGLQDQYADQMNGDFASDDRLDKRNVMILKALSDQENSIQKQLLRMNVSKEGGKHEKNW